MFPTPNPLEPVNNDAGMSGDVTFSQTPGVPIAGGSAPPVPPVPVVPAAPSDVCALPPHPITNTRATAPNRPICLTGLSAARRTPCRPSRNVANRAGVFMQSEHMLRAVAQPKRTRTGSGGGEEGCAISREPTLHLRLMAPRGGEIGLSHHVRLRHPRSTKGRRDVQGPVIRHFDRRAGRSRRG